MASSGAKIKATSGILFGIILCKFYLGARLCKFHCMIILQVQIFLDEPPLAVDEALGMYPPKKSFICYSLLPERLLMPVTDWAGLLNSVK